jgi:hypothetical protein
MVGLVYTNSYISLVLHDFKLLTSALHALKTAMSDIEGSPAWEMIDVPKT